MRSDDELLLEEDWLDQVPESSAPAQPMVVIHYRNRGVPLWVLVPLVLVIPIGGVLVYDRFVVEADRAVAVQARRALRDRIAVKRVDAPIRVEVAQPKPLVLNSQPVESKSRTVSTVSPTLPSPTVASKPSTVPSTNPTKPVPAESLQTNAGSAEAPSKTPPVTQPTPKPPTLADGSASPDPKTQTVVSEAEQSRVQLKLGAPDAVGKETAMPPAIVAHSADGGTAAKDQSTSASGEPEAEIARGQVQPPVQPLAPLTPVAKKQAAIGTPVYEERVKFRQEVKDALSLNVKEGGAEIDRLSRRHGQDRDPEKFAQARQAWFHTRMSPRAKVRLVRSLGLPESVILDFLSADLHSHMGSRGGPRDINDVRMRAAKLLLSYELPAPAPSTPGSVGPSSPDE